MEMTFEPRATGWRGRGRPAREPSERVVQLLTKTALTESVATVPLGDDPDKKEIQEFISDLKAAQRKLGGKVHWQIADNSLRFYWERPERRPAS